MNKLKTILIVAGFLILFVVIVGVFALSNHYLSSPGNKNSSTVECEKHGTQHIVIIQNNKANPDYVSGKLCDTLTITNEDSTIRLMAFGPHEDHQPYDGVTEKVLDKGQSLTVTLNQLGTFHFHDHIGDIVQGDFTVTR